MSLFLHLKSGVATTLTNNDGSHSNNRTTSHHERVEGWTEVFGNNNRLSFALNAMQRDDENKCDFGYDWKLDDNYVRRTRNAQIHESIKKSPSIRIDQYRPCFDIQLFLRLTSTPHIVFNSPNSSTESNGPLPTLIDLDKKAFVGTHTPTHKYSRLDGIFSYLLENRNQRDDGDNDNDNSDNSVNSDSNALDNDIINLNEGQKAERKSIMSQYHELNMILKCLRYGHSITWDELYRRQCIKAKLHPNGDTDEMVAIGAESYFEKRGWSFMTWFQIWAERIVAKKDIVSDSLGKVLMNVNEISGGSNEKGVNLKKAVSMAGEIYSSLDWKIGQSTNGNLLDTEELSLVDVLLFGHLAEALCDIHLVPILIEYKNLISFFQNTYGTYFGKEYQVSMSKNNKNNGDNNDDNNDDVSWIKWNDRINALNQFNRIPMNDVERKIKETLDGEGYQDAIMIMQSVALHCHDLREVLADVALMRKQEDELYGADSVPKSMVGRWMYRLRMGGDLDPKLEEKKDDDENEASDQDDNMTKKNKQHLKKVLREAKRNDELWISATLCATVIGLFASASSASK